MKEIHIGTSGYSYKHWQGSFYPEDLPEAEWLRYYAKRFNSLELNVTYYRLPTKEMYESWLEDTPPEFTFSLKGSRYITHTKRLHGIENALSAFIEGAQGLKTKARVILWQFAPNFSKDGSRLDRFLTLLDTLPFDQAFEFRHPSWFEPDIFELLSAHNASLVIADSPDYPKTEIVTADFAYLRFHGGQELYGSNYTPKELSRWAENISALKVKKIYAYFNNDALGFATANAEELKKLLGGKNKA